MLIQVNRNEMSFMKPSMNEGQIIALKNLVELDRGYGNLVLMREVGETIVVKAPRSKMYMYLYKLTREFDIELM